jgi:hypothetical protein
MSFVGASPKETPPSPAPAGDRLRRPRLNLIEDVDAGDALTTTLPDGLRRRAPTVGQAERPVKTENWARPTELIGGSSQVPSAVRAYVGLTRPEMLHPKAIFAGSWGVRREVGSSDRYERVGVRP